MPANATKKAKKTEWEPGYTPANLRILIEEIYGMTQKEFADHMGVSERTVRGWLADVTNKSWRNMSHDIWLNAMSLIKYL